MAHKITVELDWDDITLLSETVHRVDWNDMRWILDHKVAEDAGNLALWARIETVGDQPLYEAHKDVFLSVYDLRKAANHLASSVGQYQCLEEGFTYDIAEMIISGDTCDCVPGFIIEYALTGRIQ